MLESRVPEGAARMTLSRYVARAYPLLSAHRVFRKRDVKVNGVRCDEKTPVSAGDVVTIYADMDESIEVVGCEGGLLAVIKPQGLPVDADADGVGVDTALARVRRICPEAELCHRLDAMTGGVLLLAYEKSALDKALEAFFHHKVDKRYTALCAGTFAADKGVYRDALVKDAANSRVRIVPAGKNGLPVETRWRIIERVDDNLSRAELVPVTGRTHQLRAHMAYYGHPLLGDDKYGDRTLNKLYRTKLCLWCSHIAIDGRVFHADAPEWLDR